MRIAALSISLALGLSTACGGDTKKVDTKVDANKVDADNTKKNERDRDSAALTPMDQGNSAPDIEMTQKIRQAVVADDTLSSNAKNIKIITNDGKVTLRGPVKDEAEKTRVVDMAKRVAGTAPVDVQLEIETQ